jgi:predicted secreted protein
MDGQPERLRARVDEPIVIRLKSNPTTGIGWQAVFDPAAVTLVERRFERMGPGIGAGGEDVLTFRVSKPGQAWITLELRRPMEKGAREVRTFELTVEP